MHQLTLARDPGLSLLELEAQTRISPEVLSSLLKELESEKKVVFRNRWYLSPCFPGWRKTELNSAGDAPQISCGKEKRLR